MTFSLVARDPKTGSFGMVLSSSSPAVAARCLHLRHGVGGAASQNITDPRLGEQLLDLLASGMSARRALENLVEHEPTIAYRQLSVVDENGDSATFSGDQVLGVHNELSAKNVAAAVNLLASTDVIDAMISAFQTSKAHDFAERLLDAIAGGVQAGGELGPLQSAGIKVTGLNGWAVTDLRVDSSEDPIGDLKKLWDLWAPQRNDYQTRGIDPSSAPSYGAPGDL